MDWLISQISKFISKIHYPCTRKLITYNQIKRAKNHLRDGDIILTHVRGELSNIFLSHWSHGGVYFEGEVHELTTHGKESNELAFFLGHKDDFAILKPLFEIDKIKLAKYLEASKNFKYDYKFENDSEKFQYCFEFCAKALMACSNERIHPVKVLFREQFLPESFTERLFLQVKVDKNGVVR